MGRVFEKLRKTYHISRFIFFDLLAAAVSWLFFNFWRNEILQEPWSKIRIELFINCFIVGVFWVALYACASFYTDLYRKSRTKEFFKLITVTCIGAVVIFFALLLNDRGVKDYTSYYKIFFAYLFLHFFITVVFKLGFLSYIKYLLKKKKIAFNTLIIGSNKRAKEILEEVEGKFHSLGMRFIGYVSVSGENKINGKLRNFGDYQNLEKVIRRCKINDVIIALESSEHHIIEEVLDMMEGYKVRINILPDIYEIILGSVKANHFFGIPLIEINQDIIPLWQKIVKRTVDIFVSMFVVVLGFPFFALIATLTKLSSSGPVFYRQERIGRDGVPFKIVKFRSMYVDAEQKGPALASENDPRITPWGRIMRKMRLDELPQFYNVLVGDMSLVGPRPERRYYIEQIVKIAPHYKHLQRVKPGITSLGQVKFGYAENVDEMVKRLKYDILYIENMSLAMDFMIILYTFLIVIQGRGK